MLAACAIIKCDTQPSTSGVLLFALQASSAHTQVLMNLVYCVAARKVDPLSAPEKFSAVSSLLSDLQAAPAARLWPPALTTLEQPHNPTYPALQQLVVQLVECIFLESDLKAKWVRCWSRSILLSAICKVAACHACDQGERSNCSLAPVRHFLGLQHADAPGVWQHCVCQVLDLLSSRNPLKSCDAVRGVVELGNART